jgi:hypothetical protein
VANAGAQYLAAVAPVNSAISSFSSAENNWTSSTTGAQAESDAQPLIASLKTLDTTLTDAQWPAAATSDVHTLIGNLGSVIGDLRSLTNVNVLDISSFSTTYERDLQTLATSVALVRHDLGLPASTGG